MRIRNTPIINLNVVRERELSPGIRYVEYRTNGTHAVNVHVMTLDRTVPGNALRLVKGNDQADGLERLADMWKRYGSATNHTVHGLVNGNFWRAYRNTPIGACVIDGEVVEMAPYKKWTSAFVDFKNAITIDTFSISGSVSWSSNTFSVSSVNRRIDSGIVLYNSFGGPTVPNVNARDLQNSFQEALKDTIFSSMDSTEVTLSQERLRQEIAVAQRESNIEFPLTKLRVRYLRSPSINVPLQCQVLNSDTGTVDLPVRGAVLSFPRNVIGNTTMPRTGDTVTIQFKTNIMPSVRFMNAVCGTPRLVRDGVAKHEAQKEGSTGRRFIAQNLARTALGVDRSGTKVLVACIESTQSTDGTMGATLQQTADIMRLLGAYNAMNLDGGGSAGMLVDGDHVFFDGEDPLTRRLSVGLAIVRLSHVLRSQGIGN
ncbi:MAG: phosphodiester glycosidase family protein [bacterium]|nr:phosphodiester glycosidase family protein [bacterium]